MHGRLTRFTGMTRFIGMGRSVQYGWIVVLAGALVLLAVQGAAAPARAARRPQRLSDRQELVEQRNATTQVFLEADGSSTAEIHGQPINYQDASGAWQPIDPTLIPSTTPGFGWQNAAAGFTLQFASSPVAPQVVMVSAGGATLGFGTAA